MTPMQALKLLDDLTGKVPLIRVDHERVQRALKILCQVIADTESQKQLSKEKKDGLQSE